MNPVRLPDEFQTLYQPLEIEQYLAQRHIRYRTIPIPEAWQAALNTGTLATLNWAADLGLQQLAQSLELYQAEYLFLTPAEMPAIVAAKHGQEHIHTEAEAYWVLQGQMTYWIHPVPDESVLSIDVTAGQLITVPQRVCHWMAFDSSQPWAAIRFFNDVTGWLPYFTHSNKEQLYINDAGTYIPQ
jgi:1,2-dihydroxy-3-keto-5-methylthiopentene dioxygenase